MSSLATYSAGAFADLSKSRVSDISSGLIYYVYRGRNAWHSTWVTHYFPGCLHTTFASAQSAAERLRGQGSVFTIREQPAVIFRTKRGVLLVTQLNTETPLAHYSPRAIRTDVRPGTQKIDGALEHYICIGAPIEGVALSFSPTSRFWKSPPPLRNSVVILASRDPEEEIEALKRYKLKHWHSHSSGSQYWLGWSENQSPFKPHAIKRLSAMRPTSSK